MSINPSPIIAFIKDTFEKTGKKTAVIGLSGGIDSAVSFALTAKAIGGENIHAYHLPSRQSSSNSLKDAQSICQNLTVINISSIIQKSWRIIHKATLPVIPVKALALPACAGRSGIHKEMDPRSPSFAAVEDDEKIAAKIRLANLAARTRMMILFDQAKKLDALVIGTENKSESMLGYFTRFGDQASDLEPICHLFKTEVITLAKELDLPEVFITKAPSADLWKGQTDAGELGFSYMDADPILAQIDKGEPIPDSPLAKLVTSKVAAVRYKHEVPYCMDKA